MTAEERSFLSSRAADEASTGRTLIGVHLLFLAILLAIALTSRPGQARAAQFVASLLIVSGVSWSIYARLLSRWIREDLDANQIAACRTKLIRKRLEQRKASTAHCLYLDPPVPREKTVVSAPVYDSVTEGDWLMIRYFPISKVLMRVEPSR